MDSSGSVSAPRSPRSPRQALARALGQVAELDPANLDESELVGVVTACARLASAAAGLKLEETLAIIDEAAARVESRALPWAEGLTTPRFRWREDHLTGRSRTLEQIRADLFVDLLRGRGVAVSASHDDPHPSESGTAGADGHLSLPLSWTGGPAGGFSAVGRLHLSIPFETLIGAGQAAGEAAGYGPLLADVSRQLAHRALASAGSTLVCWTVTDDQGRALTHGTSSYRPSSRMRAEILARPRAIRARPRRWCRTRIRFG